MTNDPGLFIHVDSLMPQDKAILRAQLKERLKTISADDRAALSAIAAQLLIGSDEYRNARTIMLFVSMASEIDTLPVASDAWQTARRVVVPRTRLEDRAMEAVLVRDFDQDMKRTPIGVREPTGQDAIGVDEIDLVLVPGMGFGSSGERIGRGAGFYDRFLANPRLRAITCGYGYELQLCDGIPMGAADVPLRMLVTDQQVRRFRRLP